MISTCLLISKSSNPFTKPLGIVPSALITTGITCTFISHWFFFSLARSMYLSLFSFYFIFTLWSPGVTKSTIWQVLFFFFQFYCWFLTILHRVFIQDLNWRKVAIICIIYIQVFAASFQWYLSVALIVFS